MYVVFTALLFPKRFAPSPGNGSGGLLKQVKGMSVEQLLSSGMSGCDLRVELLRWEALCVSAISADRSLQLAITGHLFVIGSTTMEISSIWNNSHGTLLKEIVVVVVPLGFKDHS